MSVPIIYVAEYSGLASAPAGGDPVAILAAPPLAQYAILATVGALSSATITSGGTGLNTGTYTNLAVVGTASGGQGGLVTVVVAPGVGSTATSITVTNPGYGYSPGAFSVVSALMSTAGAIVTTFQGFVLPAGPPLNPLTRFVEMSVDANGPALVGFNPANNVLTTAQAFLTTAMGLRLNSNERIVRGVSSYSSQPVQGAGGATFALPIGLQVIMGTAAA
jgi:hypothetical protein